MRAEHAIRGRLSTTGPNRLLNITLVSVRDRSTKDLFVLRLLTHYFADVLFGSWFCVGFCVFVCFLKLLVFFWFSALLFWH